MDIHPTALVSPKAELADDVVIQAYSIIGHGVTIGSGTIVGPHAVVDGRTTIGAGNRIYPFTSIGYPPQDVGYRGEETQVIVGDHNVIRENATINKGTERGGGATRVGNHNYIMAYAHIAHDCQIGNHVIMANAATLAGHVHIDDHAILGGLVAVAQYLRIGTYAFIGGKSGINSDMPPYMLASGTPAKLFGPNVVGLKRHNFSHDAVQALKKSYRILFRSKLPFKEAVEKVRQEVEPLPEVETLVQFVLAHSERGIMR
jgi:UDP-N-acetylglucosamine acyltransferase